MSGDGEGGGKGGGMGVRSLPCMAVGDLAALLGPVWPDVRIVLRTPSGAFGLTGVGLVRCDETGGGAAKPMLVLYGSEGY